MTKDQEISSVIERLFADDLTTVQLKWYLSKWGMAADDFFAMARKRSAVMEMEKTKGLLCSCLIFLFGVYMSCTIMVGLASGHFDLFWIFR